MGVDPEEDLPFGRSGANTKLLQYDDGGQPRRGLSHEERFRRTSLIRDGISLADLPQRVQEACRRNCLPVSGVLESRSQGFQSVLCGIDASDGSGAFLPVTSRAQTK